jgi:hypothetical protein
MVVGFWLARRKRKQIGTELVRELHDLLCLDSRSAVPARSHPGAFCSTAMTLLSIRRVVRIPILTRDKSRCS